MSNMTCPAEDEAGANAQTASSLLPQVYTELRRLAQRKLEQEPEVRTLQATALVHEAYLRVARHADRQFNGARHFFAAAAEAMRRILVDQARRRKSLRRGGAFVRVEWTEQGLAAPGRDDQLLALDEALDRFAGVDPHKSELIKLRFFAGCSFAEAAQAIGVSEPTAKRHWKYARAWLVREMKRQTGD